MQERIREYKQILEDALMNLEQPSTLLNQLLEKPWFQEKPFHMLYQ